MEEWNEGLTLLTLDIDELVKRAKEIYAEEFSGGRPLEEQWLPCEVSARDMLYACIGALRQMADEGGENEQA